MTSSKTPSSSTTACVSSPFGDLARSTQSSGSHEEDQAAGHQKLRQYSAEDVWGNVPYPEMYSIDVTSQRDFMSIPQCKIDMMSALKVCIILCSVVS